MSGTTKTPDRDDTRTPTVVDSGDDDDFFDDMDDEWGEEELQLLNNCESQYFSEFNSHHNAVKRALQTDYLKADTTSLSQTHIGPHESPVRSHNQFANLSTMASTTPIRMDKNGNPTGSSTSTSSPSLPSSSNLGLQGDSNVGLSGTSGLGGATSVSHAGPSGRRTHPSGIYKNTQVPAHIASAQKGKLTPSRPSPSGSTLAYIPAGPHGGSGVQNALKNVIDIESVGDNDHTIELRRENENLRKEMVEKRGEIYVVRKNLEKADKKVQELLDQILQERRKATDDRERSYKGLLEEIERLSTQLTFLREESRINPIQKQRQDATKDTRTKNLSTFASSQFSISGGHLDNNEHLMASQVSSPRNLNRDNITNNVRNAEAILDRLENKSQARGGRKVGVIESPHQISSSLSSRKRTLTDVAQNTPKKRAAKKQSSNSKSIDVEIKNEDEDIINEGFFQGADFDQLGSGTFANEGSSSAQDKNSSMGKSSTSLSSKSKRNESTSDIPRHVRIFDEVLTEEEPESKGPSNDSEIGVDMSLNFKSFLDTESVRLDRYGDQPSNSKQSLIELPFDDIRLNKEFLVKLTPGTPELDRLFEINMAILIGRIAQVKEILKSDESAPLNFELSQDIENQFSRLLKPLMDLLEVDIKWRQEFVSRLGTNSWKVPIAIATNIGQLNYKLYPNTSRADTTNLTTSANPEVISSKGSQTESEIISIVIQNSIEAYRLHMSRSKIVYDMLKTLIRGSSKIRKDILLDDKKILFNIFRNLSNWDITFINALRGLASTGNGNSWFLFGDNNSKPTSSNKSMTMKDRRHKPSAFGSPFNSKMSGSQSDTKRAQMVYNETENSVSSEEFGVASNSYQMNEILGSLVNNKIVPSFILDNISGSYENLVDSSYVGFYHRNKINTLLLDIVGAGENISLDIGLLYAAKQLKRVIRPYLNSARRYKSELDGLDDCIYSELYNISEELLVDIQSSKEFETFNYSAEFSPLSSDFSKIISLYLPQGGSSTIPSSNSMEFGNNSSGTSSNILESTPNASSFVDYKIFQRDPTTILTHMRYGLTRSLESVSKFLDLAKLLCILDRPFLATFFLSKIPSINGPIGMSNNDKAGDKRKNSDRQHQDDEILSSSLSLMFSPLLSYKRILESVKARIQSAALPCVKKLDSSSSNSSMNPATNTITGVNANLANRKSNLSSGSQSNNSSPTDISSVLVPALNVDGVNSHVNSIVGQILTKSKCNTKLNSEMDKSSQINKSTKFGSSSSQLSGSSSNTGALMFGPASSRQHIDNQILGPMGSLLHLSVDCILSNIIPILEYDSSTEFHGNNNISQVIFEQRRLWCICGSEAQRASEILLGGAKNITAATVAAAAKSGARLSSKKTANCICWTNLQEQVRTEYESIESAQILSLLLDHLINDASRASIPSGISEISTESCQRDVDLLLKDAQGISGISKRISTNFQILSGTIDNNINVLVAESVLPRTWRRSVSYFIANLYRDLQLRANTVVKKSQINAVNSVKDTENVNQIQPTAEEVIYTKVLEVFGRKPFLRSISLLVSIECKDLNARLKELFLLYNTTDPFNPAIDGNGNATKDDKEGFLWWWETCKWRKELNANSNATPQNLIPFADSICSQMQQLRALADVLFNVLASEVLTYGPETFDDGSEFVDLDNSLSETYAALDEACRWLRHCSMGNSMVHTRAQRPLGKWVAYLLVEAAKCRAQVQRFL